jgi:hypothetical protein
MTDTGIDRDDLPQAFAQPNGVAEAITRLVVTEGGVHKFGHVAGSCDLQGDRVYAPHGVPTGRSRSFTN